MLLRVAIDFYGRFFLWRWGDDRIVGMTVRHFQARDGPALAPLAIRSDWVRRHPIAIVRSSN